MSASNQLAAFNYAVQPLGNLQIKNITAAYIVTPSDSNFIINSTSGVYTISIAPASSFTRGFNCFIWNTSTVSTDVITIDPNGAETIDGRTTVILRRGEGTQIICDGTNWQTGNKKTMRGYAENIPISYTRASAAGSGGTAVGGASNASGQDSIAVGYTCTASGTGAMAGGYVATAGSDYSLALGGGSGGYTATTATGAGAIALGNSYASGADSFAVHVAANGTSTYGAKSTNSIALGRRATASATSAVAIGDTSTSNAANTLAIGAGATASALGAVCIGNNYYVTNPTASGASSIAIGDGARTDYRYSVALGAGAVSSVYGKYNYAGGFFAGQGDAQYGITNLRASTTSATSVVATSDGAAASSTNQVILPNSSAFAFTGTVVARQQASGGTASAAWKVEGLIRREANAASTTLVFSMVTAIINTPLWTLALTADTTNGGLTVTATGAAATNIQWVATIQTIETTYA